MLTRTTDRGSLYTSDRRLYTDAEGNVVEQDDPKRQRLLVAEGGTLTTEQAKKAGLLNDDGTPKKVEAKKQEAPAENKSVKGPHGTK